MSYESFKLMGASWPIALAAAAIVALVMLGAFYVLRANSARRSSLARERLDQLDTVADWPPEGTRLLNSVGRKAHEALLAALPEYMIFAQVPLARFVRVPRRQSYSEWITRVGHLAVDFLICDESTLALGVVIVRSMDESPRALKRRDRITRVLQRAGIKVFLWREEALPSAAAARAMIMQAGSLPAFEEFEAAPMPFDDAAVDAPSKLPAPDMASREDVDPWGSVDRPREPPPSTWFDDLDNGQVHTGQSAARRGSMR